MPGHARACAPRGAPRSPGRAAEGGLIAVAPLYADPRAPLARAHPLPKLGAALAVMVTLFVTVDTVTSLVVMAALAAAIPFTGLPLGPLLRRLAPLATVAIGIALFNTIFAADPRGATIVVIGPVRVTDASLAAGVAAALRLLGIAASGVLVLATIDPTDLADALVEHVHAPPRFVLGALAAWRLAPLFGHQWWVISLARRARGIETRGSVQGLLSFPGRVFGLLVGAIRRGTELGLAMDARGFGTRPCRTLARPRPIRMADWAVLVVAIDVCVAATALSIALGTWRPLLTIGG